MLIVVIANSVQLYDSRWNGALVMCLTQRSMKYDCNFKLMKHFAPSNVIDFGIPNRTTVSENFSITIFTVMEIMRKLLIILLSRQLL